MRFNKYDAIHCLRILGIKQIPFTVAELVRGMNVELEHSDITCGDALLSCRIALAHLRENKHYYTILRQLNL